MEVRGQTAPKNNVMNNSTWKQQPNPSAKGETVVNVEITVGQFYDTDMFACNGRGFLISWFYIEFSFLCDGSCWAVFIRDNINNNGRSSISYILISFAAKKSIF